MNTLDFSNRGANNQNITDLITEGTVINVDRFYLDGTINVENNGNIIKVKPFLPLHLMVLPKNGENVNLILKRYNKSEEYLWVGPINYDYNHLDNANTLVDKVHYNGKPITKIPEAKGIYPKLDDVIINGRYNSDIILGKNKLRLRTGFRKINDYNVYNNRLQTYNLLTNYEYGGVERGVNLLVSQHILLASQNGLKQFEINDANENITNETLTKMINEMESMVYGDKLVEFLLLIVDFVCNHTHNFHKMKADNTENVKKIKSFNLTNILSKYIKLN